MIAATQEHLASLPTKRITFTGPREAEALLTETIELLELVLEQGRLTFSSEQAAESIVRRIKASIL